MRRRIIQYIEWRRIVRHFRPYADELWGDVSTNPVQWVPTDYLIDGATLLRMDDQHMALYRVGSDLCWRSRPMPHPVADAIDFRRDSDNAEYAVAEDELRGLTPDEQIRQTFRLWLIDEGN